MSNVRPHKTMRNHTLALLSSALALFAGCSSDLPKPSPNDPLIGCWSGEDFQPVLQRKAGWFMNRRPEGIFTIEFAATERGVALPIQTEEGRWTHHDGTYTTVTTRISGNPVDSKDPQYTDVYEVKSVAGGVMTYYHAKTKLTFTSKKVPCERGAA